MLIVDGHEDLAYNVLVDGRNYLRSAYATRADEEGGPVPDVNGRCMLGLPEWLSGGVAVVVATITAIPREHANPGEAGYPNAEAAYQQAIAQLNIYKTWAAENPQIAIVTRASHLDDVLRSWEGSNGGSLDRRQVGLVLLIENADLIRDVAEVDFWHEQGVRLIGPAWHSNRYSGSSMDGGPLTDLGRDLLDVMGRLGMILDLTHMSDEAGAEALDRFGGTVVASHVTPRRMVEMHRLPTDETIKEVVAHDGIVGVMPANWALVPAWSKTKPEVHLDKVVEAIDIVCDLAGDALHVGVGTDFDGGFGAEATPVEFDTIADLPRLADALDRRGYDRAAVEGIMGGNWLRVLRRHLPEGEL